MDSHDSENMTRRRFVQGIAGAAVCCACYSGDVLAASEGDSKQDGNVHLAAACGTFCGACPAYLAKHGDAEHKKQQQASSSGPAKGIPNPNWMDGLLCDGCLSGGMLAPHCQNCAIRLCAAKTQKDSRCTECKELPCYRVKNLINMGNYLHRQEYLPNLQKFREMGVQQWAVYEQARWRCPQCRLPMRWYDAQCPKCGAPRSERVFPLT